MDRFQRGYREALDENSENENKWLKYKSELAKTKESLNQFVKSHSLEIMVPMGKKAFVRGKLQHTNEVTVCHGSSLFSDCSSDQAIEILELRSSNCDVQLKALEKEKELFENKLDLPQDAFVHAQGREIIEKYNEDAENEWRKKHAKNVRKQKQRERQERQKQSEKDENVNKILDDYEMMEELAEELESLEIEDDDTLSKVLSGTLKIPASKKRIAHNSDNSDTLDSEIPPLSSSDKSSPEINNNDLIAQNNQEIVDLLKTYRCKIKEVLRNVKKDDERNVNLFLDLIELKDDIEDDIRKMNDDDEEEYSDSDERDSDDETTASIELKPPEDTKRKVRFSTSLEDVKLIESKSELYENLQSENNTIQIHFQHSNAKLSLNAESNDNVVAHPGEIYAKFHKSLESPAPLRKSILKHRGKDEKVRETMDEKPIQKIFSSDIQVMGDVVEHKKEVAMLQEEIIHITAKDEAPKKVSKFKQMRLKS